MDAHRPDVRLIFNGHAQTEDGPHIVLIHAGDQRVGKGEVVAGGIGFIRVKVAENVGDIHKAVAAERPAHVMQAGIGDVRVLQMLDIGKIKLQKIL